MPHSFMHVRLLLQLVATLLFSAGLATGTQARQPAALHGAAEHAATADAAASVGVADDLQVAAARPSFGTTTAVLTLVESESRSGRVPPVGARQRAASCRSLCAPSLASGDSRHCDDVTARLLRGGMDSSTLGTPPPAS